MLHRIGSRYRNEYSITDRLLMDETEGIETRSIRISGAAFIELCPKTTLNRLEVTNNRIFKCVVPVLNYSFAVHEHIAHCCALQRKHNVIQKRFMFSTCN